MSLDMGRLFVFALAACLGVSVIGTVRAVEERAASLLSWPFPGMGVGSLARFPSVGTPRSMIVGPVSGADEKSLVATQRIVLPGPSTIRPRGQLQLAGGGTQREYTGN